MGIVQNLIRKWKDKKEEKEDYEREQRMMEKFEARKMGSDERELKRFHEEDRKKMIKKELARRRKIMNDDVWRGKKGNPVYTDNVINGQEELFNGSQNMFLKKSGLFNRSDLFFGK